MKTTIDPPVLDNLRITDGVMSACENVHELLSVFLKEIHDHIAAAASSTQSKVEARKLLFIRDAIRGLYLDEYPKKLLREVAINYSPTYESLWETFFGESLAPAFFEVIQSGSLKGDIRERLSWLKGPQHVVRREDMSSDAGKSAKLEAFLTDVFGYVDTGFAKIPLFKDTDLETLLSNDGITLEKKNVNALASFFSDGDSNYKDKEYDPSKYYGGYPVPEETVKVHLRSRDVPRDQAEKLIAIMKVSRRFYKELVDGEERYCLKTQYLKNYQAYSVAVLYQEGKPLHLEEINRHIAELARRYPLLMSAPSLESCQLRRKPVIEKSGSSGERRLKFWAKAPDNTSPTDVRAYIRTFVEKEYARTGRPIPLEAILDEVQRCGFTTKRRSVQTYASNVCTSIRKKGYVPKGTPLENKDERVWYGDTPRLLRTLAEVLLRDGKDGMTYSQLRERMEENGTPVNATVMKRTIEERNDSFLVDKSLKPRVVRLAPHLTSSRTIRQAFPDKETKLSARHPTVTGKILDYLWEQPGHTASQNLLAGLFEDEFPTFKDGKPIIRKLLNDTDLFIKTRTGAGTARDVSLNPVYVEKRRLEAKETQSIPTGNPDADAVPYDYSMLKESIVRHHAKFFDAVIAVDDLPRYVDEMVGIMKNGKKELAPNSVFSREDILVKMHKYYCQKTSPKERDNLRISLLNTAECYLKNFAFLAHGKEYQENENLGFVMTDLKDSGDIPTWRYNPSSEYEQYGNQINNIAFKTVRPQRNTLMGHAGNALDMADSVAIQGIEGCIKLFIHLAYRLVKSGRSAV